MPSAYFETLMRHHAWAVERLLDTAALATSAELEDRSRGLPPADALGRVTLSSETRLAIGDRILVAIASADLGDIVRELRQVLARVDSLLDDTLPPHAELEATAARERLVGIIEDALDLIEVDEALREAGDERVPWEQFRSEFPPD